MRFLITYADGRTETVETVMVDRLLWEKYAHAQRPPMPSQPIGPIGPDGKPGPADMAHFPLAAYYAHQAWTAATRGEAKRPSLEEWAAGVAEVMPEGDEVDDLPMPRPTVAAL